MAILSRGGCVQWVEVGGRKVKLKCLGGVQSVNICTPANRAGEYEGRQFLKKSFRTSVEEVDRFANVESLKSELHRRVYRQLV